jgi:transcription antitermination factor NusG
MSLPTGTGISKWYPVYTHARAEKQTWQLLTKKGITAYLPLQKQLKQWSDRKKWVEEPFIKSYVFVKIKEQEQTEVLEDLKLLTSSSYDLEITEESLQPGEKIVIKAGPLKGMLGEIISYRSQKQLILRLESLGCSIIVHVAASMIERF